jgi:copper chaperone CopZ
VKMDCDGCERRVKNAVTTMKGYIVKLALCVCVFPLFIEALFCPLDCNSVTYISCK